VGRPREHDEETRLALLEAAERILDAHGPDAVSVRAVADEAGTSTRAVYSLFGSKDGLLAELSKRAFVVLAGYMDALPMDGDPVEDLIAAGMGAFRRFANQRPALFRLAFQRILPSLELPGDYWRTADATFGRLVARVERVEAEGGLDGRDPRAVATEFTALCEGLMTVELRGRLMSDRADEIWRDALEALVRGYAGASPSSARRKPARPRRR
jgi:AcrR family transcriptional regulator